MKIITSVVWLSVALFPLLGFAQHADQLTGTVHGFVFDGSRADSRGRGSVLAGHEVVLREYVDGSADGVAQRHTITDAAGRFEFTDLNVGKRFAFAPVSVKDGIEYVGSVVTLTADSLSKRSDVAVFDTTRSDSGIVLSMQHIIITPGKGTLQVHEVYVFSNESKYTYLGHPDIDHPDKTTVLQLDLPEHAQEIQVGGDLMGCCAVVTEGKILDTMAFQPGVRRAVVSYLLPYQGGSADLLKTVHHPTAMLDVFLPENAGSLEAPKLSSRGGFSIREESYQRFTGTALAKGTKLTLALTGLPEAPRDWRWLPPVLLAALILGGLALHRVKKTPAHVHPRSGEGHDPCATSSEKQRIIDELRQAEAVFKAGAIDESTYISIRTQLQEQVQAIDSQQEHSYAARAKNE